MDYLLRPMEVEKLKGKITELEKEEAEISSKVKRLIEEDREFLRSEEYRILKRRIRIDIPNEKQKIKEKLKHIKLVDENDCDFDGVTVSVFTKVTLDYDGEIEKYKIVPLCESSTADDEISCNSPIAQRILGKKIGDVVNFNNMKVTIVDVEKC